jgi:hypothetical protein
MLMITEGRTGRPSAWRNPDVLLPGLRPDAALYDKPQRFI